MQKSKIKMRKQMAKG